MFDYEPREWDGHERDDGVCAREENWVSLGRGPNSASAYDERPHPTPRDRDEDRASLDPRDVFSRDLDLPGGPERELVRDRDRDYRLNGSDARTLSTVGALRVVSEREFCDTGDGSCDVRDRDLRHLER